MVKNFLIYLYEFVIIIKSYNVVVLGAILGLMYLAKICNQAKLLISNGYPKHKNPKSIQEMGLYNSTMALSTGLPLASI